MSTRCGDSRPSRTWQRTWHPTVAFHTGHMQKPQVLPSRLECLRSPPPPALAFQGARLFTLSRHTARQESPAAPNIEGNKRIKVETETEVVLKKSARRAPAAKTTPGDKDDDGTLSRHDTYTVLKVSQLTSAERDRRTNHARRPAHGKLTRPRVRRAVQVRATSSVSRPTSRSGCACPASTPSRTVLWHSRTRPPTQSTQTGTMPSRACSSG